jgi:hypothetical protein
MIKCSCGQRDRDKCNKENGLNQGKMCLKEEVHIPSRDKTQVAIAKPNDLTVDEAFKIAFDRYESVLEELAKK